MYESRQESPSDSSLQKRQQELPSSSGLPNRWTPSSIGSGSIKMNRNDPIRKQTYESSPGSQSTHNIWSASTTNLDVSYGYRGVQGEMSTADTSSYNAGSMYSGDSQRYYGSNANNQELGFSVDSLGSHVINSRMGQLHLGTAPQNFHSAEHHSSAAIGGGLTSVPTMTSGTSSAVPGVIGASSGSTGGSTARSVASSWGFSQQSQPQDRFDFKLPPRGYAEPPGFGRESKRMEYQPPFAPRLPFNIGGESGDVLFPLDRRTGVARSQSNSTGSSGYHDQRRNQQKHENKGRGDSRRQHDSRNHRSHFTNDGRDRIDVTKSNVPLWSDDLTTASSKGSSEAIRMLMNAPVSMEMSTTSSKGSALAGSRLPLDDLVRESSIRTTSDRPILPSMDDVYPLDQDDDSDDAGDSAEIWGEDVGPHSPTSKKKEWLLRMNRRMQEIPIGQLDPSTLPVSAIMNAWAKTKSAQGASMVELWLRRVQDEAEAGNTKVVPNTKLFTMAGKLLRRLFGATKDTPSLMMVHLPLV